MTAPFIETPRGHIIIGQNHRARLEWSPAFVSKWGGRYSRAQEWLDNAIVKDTDKFVPFRTGMMKLSGVLGTVPGSGLVSYIAPYSRAQYYSAREPGATSPSEPLRGPFWFKRSKAVNKGRWISGVRMIAGRG